MNKKILLIIIPLIVLLSGFGGYYYFNKEDDKNTLTVSQKKWIEENKNKLIDLSVPSDIPILSESGSGVIFDFLENLEDDTKLEFNKLSYVDKATTNYAFKIVDEIGDNDLLIYRDNYVLITKNRVNYATVSDIQNITIGVVKQEAEIINKYLSGTHNIVYKEYENVDSIVSAMSTDAIDAMVVPKLENLDKIVSDDNLHIAYNITEYNKDYVLSLGSNEELNKILTQYFNMWNEKKFSNTFNSYLAKSYFDAKEIGEKEQVKFRSKRYTYGFVVNSPYDVNVKKGLQGFNYSFIADFAKSANIEINYKKYSSYKNLVADLDANKLDFVFNDNSLINEQKNLYSTVSVYDELISVISDKKNNIVVNSVNSLKSQEVLTIKDSKVDTYLKEKGIKTINYDNINELISNLDSNELAAIDNYSYDYFIRNDIKSFKNIFSFNLDEDYNYVIHNNSANEIFCDYFDFYLSFIDNKTTINNSYAKLLNYNDNNKLMTALLIVFVILVLVLTTLLVIKIRKLRKDHNAKLTKTEKLRYIDSLTSLKNRNYLNDNIKKWDESEVYPQAIIIVDLNNIAYINDNFGHAEGDKIIVESSSILINNQMPNSEIVRTNGNEFLIFMIGKEEKEVISYIRKLNKELKKLSHGFGAAIGYSMIVDEIKTIDDAVNEATIAMRYNKEERGS